MKIGLFFGSFNPIHIGHLIIANTVLNQLSLSTIWFIVSPQNPLKLNSSLLAAEKRLELVGAAINNDHRFLASDVEFNLPIPSYTIDTLYYLEKHHPECTFYLVMGSDSFLELEKWKGYSALVQKNIVVYQRPDFPVTKESMATNIKVITSPLLAISATEIRALIKEGKSIRYLVPEIVMQLIDNQSLYK